MEENRCAPVVFDVIVLVVVVALAPVPVLSEEGHSEVEGVRSTVMRAGHHGTEATTSKTPLLSFSARQTNRVMEPNRPGVSSTPADSLPTGLSAG